MTITLVSDTLLSSLSHLKSSHGILALMKFPTSLPVMNGASLLYLDGVQIPSNLGAIIRNAVAFGCGGVYMSHQTCDPLSPEAIRASAGHYRHLPIITASLCDVKKHHPTYRLYKIDGHGDTSLHRHLFDMPTIFVIGSESGFCKETQQELAHVPSICIPIHPRVDSLNVSVATGILLYSMSCYTEKNRD
jgi:tRNA G18 (ribose-2'-O)-methylase SpoU